jgi:C4-type Zn-finger protein
MRFEGEQFTLILDDPVGHVFVKDEPSTKHLTIKEEFYERTWSQNKEVFNITKILKLSSP